MSHSRIFDEYARIMSEKRLLKTADKKDSDYNTVPDKAGPDMIVDETGWELTEIAHPDQIQVAESRLNDGIVENGVEQQKAMIDVALRNPRGVLASTLMQTLVKAANTLDSDMTDESIKMAAEIDAVLFKLADDGVVDTAAKTVGYGVGAKKVWDKLKGAWKWVKAPAAVAPAAAAAESAVAPAAAAAGEAASFAMPAVPAAETAAVGAEAAAAAEAAALAGEGATIAGLSIPVVGWIAAGVIGTGLLVNYLSNLDASEIYESFGTAAKHLDNLDFDTGSPLYNLQQQIVEKLKSYEAMKRGIDISTDQGIANSLKDLATAVAYVQQMDPKVKQLVQLSDDGKHWYSIDALSRDKGQALQHWNDMMKFCAQWQQEKKAELSKINAAAGKSDAPKAKTDKPNKAPASAGHNYYVRTPEVKELQQALGITGPGQPDGKFGPNTFKALQQAATNNSLLTPLMENMPKTYQGWDNVGVGNALKAMQDAEASTTKAKQPEIQTPYTSYDEGYQGAKAKPYPKDMDKE